jgi:hypothetical protein
MNITAFKFGIEDVTVKYEDGCSAYTLKTEKDPESSLYSAASDIAEETRDVMGFQFPAAFSALTINSGEKVTATVTLDAATALREKAEVKCPKISRAKKLDPAALEPALPGIGANTIQFRYADHENLNLAIDVFLKEAEAFVKAVRKHEKEPSLFDEAVTEETPA